MTSKPRIIFMGTPDFAVASLAAMHEAGHQVVAVITAPDKPAGRGRKLRPSAVKQYALEQNLPILQPSNLKDELFLAELKALKAELQVVVAFRMLPKVVWQMPPLGTFNLHASLLPAYRGAAPINWALINGENQSGVTTFMINEEIDTGAILKQKTCEIGSRMNAGALHDALMILGSKLVLETIEELSMGKLKAKPQSEGSEKAAPKLNKENTRIQWSSEAEVLYNFVRGLSPFPGAWTMANISGTSGSCKIFALNLPSQVEQGLDLKLEPGKLMVKDKKLFVGCKNGHLEILEMQLPGKRKMSVKDLLNGLRLSQEDHFL